MADGPLILLIDDSPDLPRQLIQAYADRYASASFVVATSGEDALARMRDGLMPNAILLDLSLPMISGFSVLETLRTTPAWNAIPVIVFTVDQSDASRHVCERLGASYFQVKPTSRTGFIAFATFLQAGLENGAFAPRPSVAPGGEWVGRLRE